MNSFKKSPANAGPNQNLLKDSLRKLQYTACTAAMVFLSVASVPQSAHAATPGLPFTEDFTDTSLRDAANTNADWDTSGSGILLPIFGDRLTNALVLGAVTPTNLSDDSGPSRSVALGDVDGDGDLDALVAEQFERNRLYLNNGSSAPFFEVSGSNVGNLKQTTRSASLVDLDRDGDLDAVFGNTGQENRYYLNNGTADPFAGALPVELGTVRRNTWLLAIGDVDNDGDQDIISGNQGQTNRIYFNRLIENGSLSFSNGVDLTSFAEDTRSVHLGDMDNDGDLDLVVINFDERNTLYLNQLVESGTFFFDGGTLFGPDPGLESFTAELADFNGDGFLDVIVGNQQIQNRIYFNDGFGGLPGGSNVGNSANTTTVALAVGDIDRDGDLDFTTGNNTQSDRVYFNNGSGSFSGGTDISNDQLITYGLAIGDIDNDGDLDVLSVNQNQNNLVYLNEGTGNPLAGVTGSSLSGSFRSHQVAIGDLSGDGLPDLVFADQATQNHIYTGNGDATFNAAVNVTGDSRTTQAIAIGDLDGDTDLDIVTGNQNQNDRVYINNGGLNFSGSNLSGETLPTFAVELVDIDQDGDLDLIAGNRNNNNDRLYLNQLVPTGTFSFSSGVNITSNGRTTNGISTGDIDQDGDIDIITANNGQNRVYRNQGGANFVESQLSGTSATSEGIALADLDGDGDLDAVVANNGADDRVYINQTNGTPGDFGYNGADLQDGVNLASLGVTVVDVDGDTILDVLIAVSDGPNRFYKGNGDGTFQPGITFTNDSNDTQFLVAADFDSDSQVEVISAEDGTPNRVYVVGDPQARTLFGAARSLRVDTEVSNIASATLQASPALPDHATVTYFMSNNGGAQFFQVTPNLPFNFPTTGTDLRWKASLDTRSPINLPAVGQVNIALNSPPTPVGSVGNQNGTQGDAFGPLDVSGNFTDPDGDDLIFSLLGLPEGSGFVIDADTGIISGTPTNEDAEASPLAVTARASDGGLSADQNFSIAVANVNDVPSFDSSPVLGAVEGQEYTYDITASDPDSGDTLTISAPTLPNWLTLTPTGPGTATLSGTPGTLDVGDNTVQLRVTDSVEEDLQDFTIDVLADSDLDGVPDNEDAFPNDPNESSDSDGDGTGDNADLDDDNDGIPDLFEIQNGLDPFDAADAALDADGDTLTNLEEFQQGTNPQLADTDGDSADDAADNCPVDTNVGQEDSDGDGDGDACDADFLRSFTVMSDQNGNGSGEIAAVRITDTSAIEIQVNDGSTAAEISTFTILNPDFAARELVTLEGAAADGGASVALAARRLSDGLPIVQIKDVSDGLGTRNLFPWSAAWQVLDTEVIDGYAPGGLPAVASLAIRKSDGLQGVEMRDPNTGNLINIVYPLGFGWTPLQLTILDVNGSPALGTLNTRNTDGLAIVQVRDAATGDLIRNVFPLGLGWSPIELKTVPDLNGNGADEVAVRMTRDIDGLEIIQIRDSVTQELVSNVYPIGAGAGGFDTKQFEVVNTNGVISLGILSVRDSDNQILVQMKNALNAAIINNTFFIGPPWELQQAYRVMPNFNGGDDDELAVLVQNSSNGDRLVQIRDSGDDAVIVNVFQPD